MKTKKESTVHPSTRSAEHGCISIDIRKISNKSVLDPGDDQMDRYKITYHGNIYQLFSDGDELKLHLVGNVEKEKSRQKKLFQNNHIY